MQDLEKFKVRESQTIKQAIRQMDEGGIGFCVCVNNDDMVVGVISDGDFRRAVLDGQSLDENVGKIINRKFSSVPSDHNIKDLEDIFLGSSVRRIPVIFEGILEDIITEERFFGIERQSRKQDLANAVVIMAGGKGKRLDPFTRILPKPLIPLGDEPIIKVIMDEFSKYGINDFHISLNDKGRMVKAYFHDHELPYAIRYIEEDKPLGTAGALKCLAGKIDQPLFVSNCDIIVYADYSALLELHNQGEYALTLVASMRHFVVPYGVCEVGDKGNLNSILEKPEYDFFVNTGLYLLEPEVLDLIPDDSSFDMTDLIKKIQQNDMKVGVFPVSERSWADIGQWAEYRETLKTLSP